MPPLQPKPDDQKSEAVTLAAYEAAAPELAGAYEALETPALASLYERWIPPGSRVLELGCGSGRDARWLARRGAQVIATDGAEGMLREALRLAEHDAGGIASQTPRFCALRLPTDISERAELFRALAIDDNSSGFDVLLAVALLQHLSDDALYRTALLIDAATDEKSALILSVPVDHPGVAGDAYGRIYFERTPEHYSALFERFGFEEVSRSSARSGPAGRECTWTTLVLLKRSGRFAARTNINGLLESDRKTATYKFALLRALCDVNITSPDRVRYLRRAEAGSAVELAAIPFSLVVERVIEYYWTIEHVRIKGGAFRPDIPAPPQISDGRSLAFAAALRELMLDYGGDWQAFRQDFYAGRLAASLNEKRAQAFTKLADAVALTLRKGPVYYAGNSLGETAGPGRHNRLFLVNNLSRRHTALTPAGLALRCGELILPADLWRELNVCAPFVRDTILLRWAQQSHRLSVLAGLKFKSGEIVEAMLPAPDGRDVAIAHDVYAEGIRSKATHCVWTGKILSKSFAVDHLLPWSRTHTNDLWNLVPSSPSANSSKSDLLPTVALMDRSADRIIAAWRLLERSKFRDLFRAQAENALLGRELPRSHWETLLFDAVVRTTDEVARQFSAGRWNGLMPETNTSSLFT